MPRRTVVTIGVFDGVHRAHRALLRRTRDLAHALKARSLAVTFDPDPQHVLDLHHAHPALMPLDVRVAALRACGLDSVQVIPFTRAFARLTARAFIERYLVRRWHAVGVVLGAGFMFGKNRQGDMELLRRAGEVRGVRVIAVEHLLAQGRPISSSRIRCAIEAGRLAQARALLGYAPTLYGRVVRGSGRGTRLGFPTANVALVSQVLPPQGVYAVWVQRRRDARIWPGVMNLGVRPTFGQGPVVCEVHLPDFTGSLRSERVGLSLVRRLRSERCFPSVPALVSQIRSDVLSARRQLSRTPQALSTLPLFS